MAPLRRGASSKLLTQWGEGSLAKLTVPLFLSRKPTMSSEENYEGSQEYAFQQGYQRGYFDAIPAHCSCFTCKVKQDRLRAEATEDFHRKKSIAQTASERANSPTPPENLKYKTPEESRKSQQRDLFGETEEDWQEREREQKSAEAVEEDFRQTRENPPINYSH